MPTRLFSIDRGSPKNPPIILIHGFPLSHQMWEPQMAFLEKEYRVIAFDLRGYGHSKTGKIPYSLEFFVDDLMEILDLFQIPKAIICGFSMGGYVALRAVERHPERASGLILCDTRSEPDTNEAKIKRGDALRLLQEQGRVPFAEDFLKKLFVPESFQTKPEEIKRIRQMILLTPEEVIGSTLMALAARTDATPGLSKISVPTLILVGEKDVITPPAVSEAMHRLIPKSKLVKIPGAGHMSNLENPEAFNSALGSFLKGL